MGKRSEEGEEERVKGWHLALLALTLLAAVLKIVVGLDHDEEYIVAMAVRMMRGDRWFAEMWELHMTSAWPAYLALLLYRGLAGSLDGAVVFLRCAATVLQFAAGWYAYLICRKYEKRDTAVLFGFAVANFLPRATMNLEYGLLEMLFVFIAVTLLYDVLGEKEKGENIRYAKVVLAGILYAAGVMAYPTIVVSFPVILAGLWLMQGKAGKKWLLLLVFAGTCAVCAVAVLGVLFSYLSIGEFMVNVKGMLSDGTHSDTMKTATYGVQLAKMAARTALIAAPAAVAYFVGSKLGKGTRSEAAVFWYYFILSGALILMGLNLTGLRPSGPIGFQTRFFVMALIAVGFGLMMRDGLVLWMYVLPGIGMYVGAMIGSNMGFEENSSFLYLAVFGAVLLLSRYAGERAWKRAGLVCIAGFVCSLIFTKGYLVRVTGTGPANIREPRVLIGEGMAKGIYVYGAEEDAYRGKMREMGQYAASGDRVLYLGDHALCQMFLDNEFTSATCISTPDYNEEWIQYYEEKSGLLPDIIFLDRGLFPELAEFKKKPFAGYLEEELGVDYETADKGRYFFVFRCAGL